jgi:preprotein translocase subunit YajC
MLIAQAAGSILGSLMLPFLIIVVMYFLLLRPQQEAVRKVREFRAALRAGDRVITSGGIYGTIVEFDGDVALLEVAPKIRVRCQRDQIVSSQPESAGGSPASIDLEKK